MDLVQQEECESIQVHGGSYDFEDFQVIVCKNQLKAVAKKVLCNFFHFTIGEHIKSFKCKIF